MGFLIGCRIIDSDNRVGDTKHFDFNNNHGHVSVLSIDHRYRCLGLGTILMNLFKAKLDLKNDLFVDLYVRRRNAQAVRLYMSLGFVIWRELPRYYRDDIGYEMRLPLTRDVNRKCLNQPKSKLGNLYSIGHQVLEMPMNYLVRLMNALCSLMMK